ncbi:MAG: helix-turn-helix transcriptional regulator [Treponema sp.]|nr:helix-turn-helix transcriptional regulator [Treponema sp.]
MARPYDLLENILIDIEKDICNGININILAEKYSLSDRHLRRLFQFAFKQPIAGYIRFRRLVASLDVLLNTNTKILAIALDYGFEYEQSYIRAFKHEFGVTPGDLRKTGAVLKVMLPLYLFNAKKTNYGMLLGPCLIRSNWYSNPALSEYLIRSQPTKDPVLSRRSPVLLHCI